MNHDQHDDDPAEQLRRAQARHDADRADTARYETLGPADTQKIPVVRPKHRRRWAIGAAVAAVLAAGIAVPALAAGGSDPGADGQAQVLPAYAGTPTEDPSDAPTDQPSTAPGETRSGGPGGPGACPAPAAPGGEAPKPPTPGAVAPAPPAPGKDAPQPRTPGKGAPQPPRPGKDAPKPSRPGKDGPKPPTPGKDAPKPPTPGQDAPTPPAPPSGDPTSGTDGGS